MGLAQGPQGQAPAPAAPVINQSDDPLLRTFRWRSIGPAVMSGRVDDIEIVESNPTTFYLGYATGGLWKTTNNGITFSSIFDTYPVSSIGDIGISQSNPDVIYVGTGEPNNRQSSSFGAGVYKSVDGGKSFQYVGLKETQSIGRIVVHPKDPNIAYVAAVGHLFGPNPERGLFKTVDGGRSWSNTRFIDNDTGFIDLVMDPANPNVLYAASYQRRRVAWGFNGGGAGSAIWKTADAGKTWAKLTGGGLPSNPIIGRIGLDVCRTKPNVVYAQIEVGPSGGTGAGVNDDGSLVQPGQRGGGGGGGRGGQQPAPDPTKSGVWRSEDGGKTWQFMSNNNNRPMYYSQVRIDPNNDQIIYTLGAGASKSTDGGRIFRSMGGEGHGDHHALLIDPANSNRLLIGNDGGMDMSYDQGATWEDITTMAAGQFYAVSADMRKPYYVCGGLQDNGSWCGPSAMRGGQSVNFDWYRIGGGDGFYTQNDPADWTIGYSESQDGNTSRYDLRTGRSQSIRPRPPQPPPAGGAGQRGAGAPDPAAAQQQFGGRGMGASGNIIPAPSPDTVYRFYWNTPFILSPHDPATLFLGGDRLFKSADRGTLYTASPDLTRNIGRNERPIMGVGGEAPMASKHDGAASYSNIVTISESPAVAGVLWVGTNDGNVQVSRDGGATWKNVVDAIRGAPAETHVSRVEASHFDGGTCYVTLDGHRADDHKPYVFVTRDYGASWQAIANNLPEGNVNVIREDPKNRNLLYLGTEYAFYVSLNGGREWKRFMNGLPTVRIDDILVHPRENDLIVGTHGRSIWIIDDITPLQQLTDAVLAGDAHVFDVRANVLWLNDIMLARGAGGAKHFRGENPPDGSAISYYLKSAPQGDVKIVITDVAGRTIRELAGTANAGINRVQWDFGATPPQMAAGRGGGGGGGRGGRGQPVEPGSYIAKVTIGGKEFVRTIVVEPDTMIR